ncbi:hypothetical protein RIF29_09018 [Crotalaria pallida]|uniref:Uncharacterized protein n=1 Tax=Crotalaria pallida TaxID=3830 RepID=A0AAN9IJH2_CROPI
MLYLAVLLLVQSSKTGSPNYQGYSHPTTISPHDNSNANSDLRKKASSNSHNAITSGSKDVSSAEKFPVEGNNSTCAMRTTFEKRPASQTQSRSAFFMNLTGLSSLKNSCYIYSFLYRHVKRFEEKKITIHSLILPHDANFGQTKPSFSFNLTPQIYHFLNHPSYSTTQLSSFFFFKFIIIILYYIMIPIDDGVLWFLVCRISGIKIVCLSSI